MTTNFDLTIFWHALYVAFAYSWLAFGATAYRQLIDKFRLRDKDITRLGEDIYFSYDPLMIYWIISFILLGILFFFIGYVWWHEARIELYAVPLGFGINTVQLLYRLGQQRLYIRTFGIMGRNIFEENFHLLLYPQIHLIEVQRDPVWSTIILYYTDEADTTNRTVHVFRRRVTVFVLPKLLQILQQKTAATIIGNNDPSLPRTE